MPSSESMVQRQKVLADFGELALRSEGLNEILTEACRLVCEALGTERAKILEIEHANRTLLLRAGVGWKPDLIGRLRLEMSEHSSETFSIEVGEPVITRNIREEDRFEIPAFLKDAGVVALVNVPIFLPGGQAYGLLQVDATEPREFGEEDTEFLRTYATILGPVIDRLHKVHRLRATEERFRLVVEGARDYAIFVCDAEDRITDWFPGAEAVLGWTAEEAVGQSSSIIFTPEDRAAHVDEDEFETARWEGTAPNRRWHLRKDGAGVFIDGSVIALHGKEGEVRGFLKIGQDITERRRAEEALRESEERLRRFGDASLDVLWIRDAETLQWEYLTPAFERIYGMEVDRALSGDTLVNWLELILPEDRDHALGNITRVRAGERVTFEYRIRRPSDGRVRWVRDTDFPLVDEEGRVRRIGGVGHDVTDLKEAEARLRESEARLRATVDAVPQIAWTARADGHHDYYNRRWYEYTGLSREQTEAQGWTDVIHPDDLARTQERWARSLRTGEDYEIEYRFRGVDGAYRWFIARGVAVRDAPDEEHPRGRVVRWFGTFTDIEDMVQAREVLARGREELEALVAARTAELTAAEETLRQAQKMEAVGQLTGGIAHDFNNMLQGVAGGLDMARRRIEEGRTAEAGRYLDASRTAVGRAAGLTRRLLAFARRQRLDRKAVDADGLVAGMADLIRRTMGPAIGVELRLRDGAGSVLCDPNELESALLNLCINARDAMPQGGRLTIGTANVGLSAADLRREEAEPGRYVALSVADTGTGMPPEVLERVFEPFFTTKPLGEGTGLGLSQIYGFVRQSGGLVRIESAPGAGTTVRLLLPLHDVAAAAEARDEPPPPHAASQATVLLVDDEEGVRCPAADRLRDMGHVVLEAADGPEALRVLALARPDLLVTDVGLPNGMNGRQVAEVAREQQPGLPVLFITGYAGTALPPGVEVIGKPFELDTLARRVGALLEKAPKANKRIPDA
ncbi:PAS domain S-box protein [Roseomonas chloroacetimidivorans]|uniref:PAS domain S-box protein n=1 Tax=Roseomonas chloroacetimidivorans TaxID=1766656 RepID=UPI003C73B003